MEFLIGKYSGFCAGVQNTYYIENEDDLKEIEVKDKDVIAIVAGASVPKYLIERIINKIKSSKVKERILK